MRLPRVGDRSVARFAPVSWVVAPLALLAVAARLLDPYPPGPLASLDADAARASLAIVVAALGTTFGMLMAWVLVAINMTARRYSLRVVDVLVSSRVTTTGVTLFASSLVLAILTQPAIRPGAPHPVSVALVVGLACACLVLILPFLHALVAMLNPLHLVGELRGRARQAMASALDPRASDRSRPALLDVVEQASDVTLASINASDIELATAGVGLLHDLLVDYQERKPDLPPAWFAVPPGELLGRTRPELDELAQRRVWFETFVGMELDALFASALGRMPDLCGRLAEVVRSAGEVMRRRDDVEALQFAARLFNTMLRAAINRHDVRAVYNVLHRYRALGESLLATHPLLAGRVAERIAYYAGESLAAGLPRAWVTAVHDLRVLSAAAAVRGAPDPPAPGARLAEVLGQAPAALRLDAAKAGLLFEAQAGDTPAAPPVVRWLDGEPAELIRRAARDVLAVGEPTFWELTGRGEHFDYATPAERARIARRIDGLPGAGATGSSAPSPGAGE